MSNSSTILHKKNYISGVVPTIASLSSGEIAINVFDGKLFIKTTDDTIKSFSNEDSLPFILDKSLSGVNTQHGNNIISEVFANVLGGYNNDVTGGGSTVINGENNDIDSDFSTIINGLDNKISINSDYSVILGGKNNLINHENVFTLGSHLSSHANNFTYVNNISAQVYFYGDGSKLTGIVAGDAVATTLVRSNSANWDSSYTTVQSNSAAWSTIAAYSSLIGNNTTNPLTATHNLNTKDIVFSIREVTTNKIIQAAGRAVDNNNLELTFNATPAVNEYDLTILSNGGIVGIGGGTNNAFALGIATTQTYIQVDTYTHNLYNDTAAGGQITVYLLPPANHISVTQHKKIGSTASIVLSAPNGATIDGQPTYTLNNQYEAIGLYSDGTNYFIQ